MSLTNGNAGQTKKEKKRAAKAREQFWQDIRDQLHYILDTALDEQRAPLEAAAINGFQLTVLIRVRDPEAPPVPTVSADDGVSGSGEEATT